jgi:hypothetical protein
MRTSNLQKKKHTYVYFMQQSQIYFSIVASLRAPSLSTFPPIRGYTSTSLGASIFNPRQNFKAYYTRGPLFRLISGDVMRSVSLASEDSGSSFTAQWRLLCFPFYAFSIHPTIQAPVQRDSIYLTDIVHKRSFRELK